MLIMQVSCEFSKEFGAADHSAKEALLRDLFAEASLDKLQS